MAKLWIFGDSFSDSCGLMGTHPYALYLKDNFNIDNADELAWQKLLSKELNLDLINKSRSGCSNTDIINQIILNINNFNPNDFIIIGWTVPSRVSLPPPIGCPYESISVANAWAAQCIDNDYNYKNYESFYLNVFFPRVDTHIDFTSNLGDVLFDYLLKNYNVKSWYWQDYLSKNMIETIGVHTNFNVEDDHPSLTGHTQLVEIIKKINWGEYVSLKDIGDDLKKYLNNPNGAFV